MIPPDWPPSAPFPQEAPLPVPYQNPWGLLGRDLRAVVASLRLQLRQLWRRNRQGDLTLPRFWPEDLAPLFWPLALALAGALLALGVVGGGTLLAHRSSGVAPTGDLAHQEPMQPVAGDGGVDGGDGTASDEPATSRRGEPVVVEPIPAEPIAAQSFPAADQSPGALEPDPLLVAMGAVDPGHWITAIRADSERGTLQLVLAAPFTALDESRQLQQAQDWQRQAMDLGFDRLDLSDRQGRPIGRQATVGSGMILLTPQHLS